jgi:hypothetical protein
VQGNQIIKEYRSFFRCDPKPIDIPIQQTYPIKICACRHNNRQAQSISLGIIWESLGRSSRAPIFYLSLFLALANQAIPANAPAGAFNRMAYIGTIIRHKRIQSRTYVNTIIHYRSFLTAWHYQHNYTLTKRWRGWELQSSDPEIALYASAR